jgi:hypothetical protein
MPREGRRESERMPNAFWKVFDERVPILIGEYSFGPGTANALAVGGTDGLLVVSAPCGDDQRMYDEVVHYGTVRALVASNAFHHLGLPQWKRRFPDAQVFAPRQAVRRVEKQSGITGIRPLADAASIAGPRVELVDMPYYKTGEVLVRINTDHGIAWYVTDIIMNLPELPRHPLFRLMFRASGSGPGLRFNNIAPLFMVEDRKALRPWIAQEFRRAQPRWLIATHGDVVDFSATPSAAESLFRSVR